MTDYHVAIKETVDARLSVYRTIHKSVGRSTTGAVSATNYLLFPGLSDIAAASAVNTAADALAYLIDIRAADYTVTGFTTKLRVYGFVGVAAAAITTTGVTFGLHPISVSASNITPSAAVSGSTSTVSATIGANAWTASTTPADFTIPSDGFYALGYTLTTAAPNANIDLWAHLQLHHV